MILTHNGDTVGFVTGGSDVGKVNQASKALPPHCAAELGEVGSMQFASVHKVHKVTCPWQSQHTVLFLVSHLSTGTGAALALCNFGIKGLRSGWVVLLFLRTQAPSLRWSQGTIQLAPCLQVSCPWDIILDYSWPPISI